MRAPLPVSPLLLLLASGVFSPAFAGGIQTSDRMPAPVVVEGSRLDQIGIAESANQGIVPREQLIEDNSVRSGSSTIINASLGYAVSKTVRLTAEVLNLADRKVSDVDYYYESRLRGEAEPSFDIHTHPAEPRTLRVGLLLNF
jgi:outer membrane receptor protein involved in Fe transport